MANSVIFIGLKVQRDTDCSFCELEYYGPLDLDDELDGTFKANPDDFDSIDSIIPKLCHWFYERLGDADCEENVDQIIELYGNDDFNKTNNTNLEGIVSLTVFSRIEFYDEPFGASLIGYDFENNSFFEEHRDEFPYSDMEDCYGEELEERYREQK